MGHYMEVLTASVLVVVVLIAMGRVNHSVVRRISHRFMANIPHSTNTGLDQVLSTMITTPIH